MAKDKKGGYHPPKGKPSGTGKPEGLGTGSAKLHEDVLDEYTNSDDQLAPNVHLRHHNRNTDKEEYQRERDESMTDVKRFESYTRRDTAIAPQELPVHLSKSMLAELTGIRMQYCVSAFLPTHTSGSEVNEKQDHKAFKNLLQQVAQQLKAQGAEAGVIERVLAPGYALLLDDTFWREQSKSLAVFITDGYFKYCRLPFTVKEQVIIQQSFFVSPLLPMLANQEYFYLLLLSKKHAKLFRADAYGIRHIPVEGMPDGIDDVVHFEEKEGKNLWRMGKRGGTGGANFHGVGAGKPDEKENIAMYLDEVDETLMKEGLADEHVPLLLAGVDYMMPIFRGVSTYGHIWETTLSGNHEHEDLAHIYQEAMKVMQPYFEEKKQKALANYGDLSATARTSSILADVVTAAQYGQVAQLFIRKDAHAWGSLDTEHNQLDVHDTQLPGDVCLINQAAMQTWLTNGEVYMLEADQLPADSDIAAVMRY